MKKFDFKLKGLLNIKIAMEREVRFELIEIQNMCAMQEGKISVVKNKVSEWSAYYSLIMKSGGTAVQLAIIDRHIQDLYRYQEQLEISLDVYNRKKISVLEQYEEVKRDLKVVEHLKDKRYQEYRAELQKEEEKMADEMATIRYTRNQVGL